MMNVNIFCLADQGQVVNGKLYLHGAGWRMAVPAQPGGTVAYVIALSVDVPWSETYKTHTIALTLADSKGMAVTSPNGEAAISIQGNLQAVRPPGVLSGEPITMPMVLPIPAMVLVPGKYIWHLTIDGASNIDWELPFIVAEAMPQQLAS